LVVEPRRRRRTPEEATREILQATEEILAERPFHQVTVSAVMARTTLSRKSFYVYFRDIPDLVTRLIRPIQDEAEALLALWTEGGDDPVRQARTALLGTARLYAQHGVMLRALSEAAARDEEARRMWRDLIEPAIKMLADKIGADVAAGRITGLSPEPTARALIGMNQRMFFEQLAGNPDADVEGVVDTLLRIWARALYPGQQARPRPKVVG
jgi:AcrR family transcriptional regulator